MKISSDKKKSIYLKFITYGIKNFDTLVKKTFQSKNTITVFVTF